MPLTYRRTVGLLVAVLLTVSSAHLSAATCKTDDGPFTGHLVACTTTENNFCMVGTFDGKSPETYSSETKLTVFSESEARYMGTSVITRTHGGATLIGEDSGVMTLPSGEFVTTVTIVDGTKQFKGATGQYVVRGQIGFLGNEVTGTFTSTVCR